jgi:hypothetical protein
MFAEGSKQKQIANKQNGIDFVHTHDCLMAKRTLVQQH